MELLDRGANCIQLGYVLGCVYGRDYLEPGDGFCVASCRLEVWGPGRT